MNAAIRVKSIIILYTLLPCLHEEVETIRAYNVFDNIVDAHCV